MGTDVKDYQKGAHCSLQAILILNLRTMGLDCSHIRGLHNYLGSTQYPVSDPLPNHHCLHPCRRSNSPQRVQHLSV